MDSQTPISQSVLALLDPGASRFGLTHCAPTRFDTLRRAVEQEKPTVLARMVRGQHMHSKASLLAEISAAFQFPLYFGYNWDALADMLSDLAWHTFDEVLLFVADADHALMHADDFAMPFFEILRDRASATGAPPFGCVFHTAPANTPAQDHQVRFFHKRLSAAGIQPAILDR